MKREKAKKEKEGVKVIALLTGQPSFLPEYTITLLQVCVC
jgi:hypothetical protein